MKKTKKIFFWILGVLVFFFIILIAVFILILALVFDSKPFNKPPVPGDTELAAVAMSRIVAPENDGKEENLLQILNIFSGGGEAIVRKELDQNEINALLAEASSAENILKNFQKEKEQKKVTLEKYRAEFKDGVFHLDFSFKLDLWTPFGSYINYSMSVIPNLEDRRITMKICSSAIGERRLPSFLSGSAENHLNNALSVIEKDPSIQQYLNAFKKIKVENGKLVIVYDQAQMALLLFRFVNMSDLISNMFGN